MSCLQAVISSTGTERLKGLQWQEEATWAITVSKRTPSNKIELNKLDFKLCLGIFL